MNLFRLFFVLGLLTMGVPSAAMAAEEETAQSLPPIEEKDVLPYLDQVIDWQHAVGELPGENAREILLRDAMRANARKVLQSSFDFAHAQAEVLALQTPADAPKPDDRRARIQKRRADNAAQVADIQARLVLLNKSIGRSVRRLRAPLLAERDNLNGQLRLAQAETDLLRTITELFDSGQADTGGGDLTSRINDLSRTVFAVPDLAKATTKPAEKSDEKDDTKDSFIQSNGIFGLISSMLASAGKRQEIDEMAARTEALRNANRDKITALRGSLQEALAQGAALGKATAKDTPPAASVGTAGDTGTKKDSKPVTRESAAEAHRRTLDALVTHYKQLAAAVVPLGQTSLLLEASERNLGEWQNVLGEQWNKIFQRLVLRLGVLGICILIPLVISELARRAAHRYVADSKRQRQLRILRQLLLGLVLTLIVILNFVTEFGSLATFAGFLTAGLAVSLQTVLVSLTAHFFFFGRFGVRAGDRVTISGVTGDVVQVGMLRIYMMELEGADTDMRPTGKIVAFPNSVLFSSTAFFKQVSGSDYGWKEMSFLLDPESDYLAVNKRIMEAVDAEYGEYKDAIELQHTVLVQSTRLSVRVPAPNNELRLTPAGVTTVVHYPIIHKRAQEIEERITYRLIEMFRGDAALKLVLSNPLRIEKIKPGPGPDTAVQA